MNGDLFGDLLASPQAVATETPPQPRADAAAGGKAGDAVVFDVETGPVDAARLEAMFEFDPAKVKGHELLGRAFDPAAVKTGNLKDQAKIDAKIAAARKAHDKAVAEAAARVAQAREEAWLAFVERAPLSPLTGRVLAIGYLDGESLLDGFADGQEEPSVLEFFWQRVGEALQDGTRLVGHNIYGFDLPFLVRRSWLLGVDIPPEAFSFGGGRWQWNRLFVDTMAVWACGVYGERISLDRAAGFFDAPPKNGEGAEFHRLFFGSPQERRQALDYLRRDLEITHQIARKMGVL